jgi:hypothetical protein
MCEPLCEDSGLISSREIIVFERIFTDRENLKDIVRLKEI